MARGRRESLEECRARLSAAAGREIDDDELNDIMELVQARMQSRVATGEAADHAARGAGADVATEARQMALVMKRERAINVGKRFGLLEDRTIAGSEYNSLLGAMGGSVHRGRMLGLSADAMGHALVERRVGDLSRELLREDLLALVARRDPTLDREIMQEWWHIKNAEPQTTNRAARRIAEIFEKHMEVNRLALNAEGAWIGKLEHYVGRQMHDMMKVRGTGDDAAYLAWRDFIHPRLDPVTFDHIVKLGGDRGGVPNTVDDFLHNVWEALSSGVHEQSSGSSWLGGFTGPSNLAKRLSQERVLHFKDPDSFHEYNTRFGHGAVIDAVLRSIERGAHNTGVMKVFGTNPEAMVKWWAGKLRDQAIERQDFKMADRLGDATTIQQTIDRMTGLANKPASMSLAYYWQTVRNIQHMARLGSAVISSINDIPATVATLRHNGVPIMQSYAHMLGSLLPYGTAARKEFAAEAGGIVHGFLGDMHARLRAEDSRYGALGGLTNTYFKLNGLNYWTDHTRFGTQTGIAARYAHFRDTAFESLPARVRTTLDRYGIGSAEWAALRQVPTRAVDGWHYLMPADIAGLSDDAVSGLGRNAARAREELQTRYGTLLTDQAREAISEPTIRHREMFALYTTPGTSTGEIARSVMQFKSFMLTFMARSLGRELFRGETRIGRFNVDLAGIAHLMVVSSIFGGFAVMLKDLLSGRNMRDISDGAAQARFAATAIAQGGGLGIYGDFLLGNVYSSAGRSLAETLSGPTIGTIGDVGRMLGILESGHGNFASNAVQFGKSNTPFINLFYIKAALDHLFFHGLQESVNPGYLRRIEQKSKRDYKQTYWLRPTEAVRY
jgi:hypothetical protein